MIPTELRDLPQWLVHRGKRPLNARGGVGKNNDPATWSTYREALAALDADGIGFAFSADDPYCGIDIDHCIGARGAIHPEAYGVVKSLNGYVEISPSGAGLHIIVRAKLKRNRSTGGRTTPWGGEIAFWQSGKFFTMSGDGRGEIREAQAEVNALIAYYFPEDEQGRVRGPVRPFCGQESDILDRVLGDARTERLWHGDTSDHAGDHSAADLALCSHLAFWCGQDAARVDALFRQSGLYREKWNEKRGDKTYGQLTIERALRAR